MTRKLVEATQSPVFDLVVKMVTVMVIPFAAWTTNSIYEAKAFIHRGDKFTQGDGYAIERSALESDRKTREAIHRLEQELLRNYVRREELQRLISKHANN